MRKNDSFIEIKKCSRIKGEETRAFADIVKGACLRKFETP